MQFVEIYVHQRAPNSFETVIQTYETWNQGVILLSCHWSVTGAGIFLDRSWYSAPALSCWFAGSTDQILTNDCFIINWTSKVVVQHDKMMQIHRYFLELHPWGWGFKVVKETEVVHSCNTIRCFTKMWLPSLRVLRFTCEIKSSEYCRRNFH